MAPAPSAAFTAATLALRMINDDLKLSEDAARYAWRGGAIQRARARFDAGDRARSARLCVFCGSTRSVAAAPWRSSGHAPAVVQNRCFNTISYCHFDQP